MLKWYGTLWNVIIPPYDEGILSLLCVIFVCLYGYRFLRGTKSWGMKFCMRVGLLSGQVFSHFGGQMSRSPGTKNALSAAKPHLASIQTSKQRENTILSSSRRLTHSYILAHIESTLFKNSFLNRCLFSYIWGFWMRYCSVFLLFAFGVVLSQCKACC